MDNGVQSEARAARPRRIRRLRHAALLLVALPLAVALAACGGGGYGSGNGDSANGPAKPAKVATPDRAPATEWTLEVGTIGDGRRVLTDGDGFTLYRFDKDSTGVSMCNDACAATWPPTKPPTDGAVSAVKDITATPGVITRADGTQQVTLNGTPLYRYAGDQKPGDATGDGISGIWHVWVVGGEPVTGMPMAGGGY